MRIEFAGGPVRDVGPQASCAQGDGPPRRDLGHDAGVPGAAGRRDAAGHEGREDARQDQAFPVHPAAQALHVGRFLEVGGNGDGARDDVEQDVPLGAENDQR